MNLSILIGRMTKEPELRRTAQGDAVTSFTLAVNRDFKSKNGQQEADFIPCVCWKVLGENVARYCKKGSQVAVKGRLQSRSYENQQNKKVFVLELICESVQFLDSKTKEAQPQQSYQQPYQAPASSFDASAQSVNGYNITENDIQF